MEQEGFARPRLRAGTDLRLGRIPRSSCALIDLPVRPEGKLVNLELVRGRGDGKTMVKRRLVLGLAPKNVMSFAPLEKYVAL